MIKKIFQPLFIFLFAFVIAIPVILPYFHQGYFPTHDGEWAVVRAGDMFRSLRDHQIPVRYSGNLNFGYGYPLFNFAYPAPYYIGTAFHFLKFGFVDSIKLLFVLSVAFSAITMYLLSKELWHNKIAGIISAIFYVYLPYRIVDLYVRGSLGESLAFVFFPLILFCASKIIDDFKTYRYLVFGSISYALLILTHNIMAVLFTPVLLVFIIAKIHFSKKRKTILPILVLILFSYLLSAFFWVPALLEKNNILLSQIPIADRSTYFVTFDQLLFPKWGYGLPDHPDGFSYQIGLAHVTTFLIIIFLLLYYWFRKRKVYKDFIFSIAAVFSITAVLLILLLFPFTALIWKVTPLLKEINYPWTLLAPIGFLLSLLTGFLWLRSKMITYILVALSLFAVIFVLPHAKPEFYFDKGDEYYVTNEATTTSSQELMPLWVKDKPTQRSKEKIEIVQGKGVIKDVVFNSNKVSFSLELNTKSLVRINTIYYPGWVIKVDDTSVPLAYNNARGVMELTIPAGKHTLKGSFGETPLRLAADAVSVVSFILVLLLLFKNKKL